MYIFTDFSTNLMNQSTEELIYSKMLTILRPLLQRNYINPVQICDQMNQEKILD